VLGIDGIALTEHDLWRPHDELVSLRARHPGLIIFEGMERSCREGHFLVFLPEHEGNRSTLPPGTVHALSPWTHARGGLLIWAHPFRFEGPRLPSWLNEVSIDGIEVASSNMNLRSAELAEKTARDYGLSVFTNSDAPMLPSPWDAMGTTTLSACKPWISSFGMSKKVFCDGMTAFPRAGCHAREGKGRRSGDPKDRVRSDEIAPLLYWSRTRRRKCKPDGGSRPDPGHDLWRL
jgi:hypothetical protein